MTHPNVVLISRFFEAYGRRDFDALRQVLAEDVMWTFPGRNPVGGTKKGIAEVVAFFDAMGGIMGASRVKAEVLVTGVNDNYVAECQHVRTARADGNNLYHMWCVLWTFRDGKIVEGRHLAADQFAADEFFNAVGPV